MSLKDFGLNQGNVSALFILINILLLLILVGAVALYFLKAMALYKMSRKQRIDREWYGFIPVFKDVLLGNVSQGRKRGGMGKNLAIFSVLKIAVGFFTLIVYGLTSIKLVFMADAALLNGENSLPETTAVIFSTAIVFIVIFAAVCLIKHIMETACCYRIYKQYGSKKAVLYTVLGFVLPILAPIFLFCVSPELCRLGGQE